MKYQFTNLATGKPCCKSDDINHLCTSCRERARALAAAAASPTETPSAPSLTDAIAARRGITAPVVNTAPMFGNGARLTTNSRPADGVDEPPSLASAITARRGGAR